MDAFSDEDVSASEELLDEVANGVNSDSQDYGGEPASPAGAAATPQGGMPGMLPAMPDAASEPSLDLAMLHLQVCAQACCCHLRRLRAVMGGGWRLGLGEPTCMPCHAAAGAQWGILWGSVCTCSHLHTAGHHPSSNPSPKCGALLAIGVT